MERVGCGIPPGLRGRRQTYKMSAFVGKCRIFRGIKENHIHVYFADSITTSIVIGSSQHSIYNTFILIIKRFQQGALKWVL